MLTANKNRLFEHLFAVYNRNLIKRRFHSFKVAGLENLINKNQKIPLLIYANHTSWWDGLLAFEISRLTRLDSFIMMDEANLRRFFLFRLLGAFSVPQGIRGKIKSISYAAQLLKTDSARTVWIFPQAEIRPNDTRPIRFFNGAARIVEKTGRCQTVALGFRLEFTGEFKPEIFINIGRVKLIEPGENFDAKRLTAAFSKSLVEVLDELKSDVLNNRTVNYQNLLSKRKS
jgi:1-acyl-sn-glycerol-3-phosphate acyltransferase